MHHKMRHFTITRWNARPWKKEEQLKEEGETWAAAYKRAIGDREPPKLVGQENLPHDEGSDAEYEEAGPKQV